VPVLTAAEREVLEYLTQYVSPARRARIETVLGQRTRLVTVVLEDVYQPHNASAVLRSCDCFGLQDVHIVEGSNPYLINQDISLGAAKWLTLHRHAGLDECLAALRQSCCRLVAATPQDADCTLDELPVGGPTAFLLGTEESGLSAAALAAADLRVAVPLLGFTQSLNVSVCAAILVREAVARLRASGTDWRLSVAEQEALRLEWYRRSIRGVRHLEARFAASRAAGAVTPAGGD